MILVTGSEGFIGRNLISSLYASGKNILEFDAKHFEPMKLFDAVDFSKIDFIYHIGAITSTLCKDVHSLYTHNIDFSIKLFEKAIANGIPLVYTSSASVFGNTMKSGDYIYNPLNYYATTKMITEMWLWENRSRFKLLSVPRLFNVYGNNEFKTANTMSPVSKFKEQALNDGIIKIFKGSENMIRDFVCIEDVVWTLKNVIRSHRSGFYDVGTRNPISFLDVARLVSNKYDVGIKFIDMPDEMKSSYQYYTRARDDALFYNQDVATWLETHQ